MIAALIAGSLFVGGMASQAQDNTTPTPTAKAHRHGMNFNRLAKQLDLTSEQKPKVQAILGSMRHKMRDLHQNTSLTPKEKRAKARTVRDAANVKLRGVLTADQFSKWEKMSARHPHHKTAAPPPQN